MRVVSLVPSWTETLIEAGIQVVGRTRFCVYPNDRIAAIPAVAGTKNWDWAAIQALKPDLLILDQEENPKFMAEQKIIPILSTHVTSVASMPGELAKLALRLNSSRLAEMASRWQTVAKWKGLSRWQIEDPIPGMIEWGRKPTVPIRNVIYVIWRGPWMTVAKSTFIGSVLQLAGFSPYLRDFEVKYPQFKLSDFEPTETMLLFSSEPYPFLQKKSVLNPVSAAYAFVEGECYSWFGARSLRFLEGLRERS